nr:MFS transporter [Gemmatimonas phototrophica]
MTKQGAAGKLAKTAIAAWHARLGKRSGVTAEYATPEADRVPFAQKLAYGMGAFVNNTLAAAIGGMLIILNLGFGMNPALVGLASALPRVTDALTDPLMGFISDHTRSRWGRRRPYIFVGAILSGVFFAVLWMMPTGKSEMFYFWYFLIGSTIFYLGYTIFATPWVALGYELTPDYNERTRLMGVQNFIGQLAYIVSPWFLWIMTHKPWFSTPVEGARSLALAIGAVAIVIGIMPAIFLRERFVAAPIAAPVNVSGTTRPQESMWDIVTRNTTLFFKGFATTIKSGPFRRLCVATFLVFNGFIMISSFQSYVIIYYVFGGNQERGAEYAGYAGTIGAISTFGVIFLVTWLATRIGKRKAFYFSTGVSMVGYALKWFCYDPTRPWLVLLPAPLMAFGLGGLFTLMGSMIADVVDVDELETHERREGMFGSIFWWVVKVGMAAALAMGGFLLNATGFDVALGSQQTSQALFLLRLSDVLVPFITSGIAIWTIAGYPITEEKAHDVRRALEARRTAAGTQPVTSP